VSASRTLYTKHYSIGVGNPVLYMESSPLASVTVWPPEMAEADGVYRHRGDTLISLGLGLLELWIGGLGLRFVVRIMLGRG